MFEEQTVSNCVLGMMDSVDRTSLVKKIAATGDSGSSVASLVLFSATCLQYLCIQKWAARDAILHQRCPFCFHSYSAHFQSSAADREVFYTVYIL